VLNTTNVIQLPAGFATYATNIGIKDRTDDFVVIAAERPVPTTAVFTKSRFSGPSVTLSRINVADGTSRAVVIVSKNANVATGPQGMADAQELTEGVAARFGCTAGDILVASTGVIGVRYPMDRVRAGLDGLPATLTSRDVDRAAGAIMTTDTVSKVATADVRGSQARIVGIAKGVGMIEPDMATMIAVVLTDADIDSSALDEVFRRVVDKTFNCVSIDTDTSTSDTAILMASGESGAVDDLAFEAALTDVCLSLTKQIARDGEGAETLIEVTVADARDHGQAKRVAKAIVNSPLVKTAVHGADPNWGRVAMAIGKCSEDTDIDQEKVKIRFGDSELYPARIGEAELRSLTEYLRGDEVTIHVSLGTGSSTATVWGCDLTDGYVRINADYTT
jgi:glutamate N-acetyltransferase/amino-acid N-acetyltransferase